MPDSYNSLEKITERYEGIISKVKKNKVYAMLEDEKGEFWEFEVPKKNIKFEQNIQKGDFLIVELTKIKGKEYGEMKCRIEYIEPFNPEEFKKLVEQYKKELPELPPLEE